MFITQQPVVMAKVHPEGGACSGNQQVRQGGASGSSSKVFGSARPLQLLIGCKLKLLSS
jgi:hypothetical protein